VHQAGFSLLIVNKFHLPLRKTLQVFLMLEQLNVLNGRVIRAKLERKDIKWDRHLKSIVKSSIYVWMF